MKKRTQEQKRKSTENQLALKQFYSKPEWMAKLEEEERRLIVEFLTTQYTEGLKHETLLTKQASAVLRANKGKHLPEFYWQLSEACDEVGKMSSAVFKLMMLLQRGKGPIDVNVIDYARNN